MNEQSRNPAISALKREELEEALEVIHDSFRTVAEEFGLTRENCPKHTSFIPLSFLETQMNWGWQMYGFFAGDQMVGYMSVSKESDEEYELHNLAVLPQYRHMGFGRRLLDHAKQTVKENGGSSLKVGMIEESEVLKQWYVENGFRHIGTKKYPHMPFTSGYLQWDSSC